MKNPMNEVDKQADDKVKFPLLTNGTVLDKEDQDDDDGDAEHERGRLKQ